MRVKAYFLGSRIETAAGATSGVPLTAPTIERCGEQGLAMLFRFGVIVCFDMSDAEQVRYIDKLGQRVRGPFPNPETESYEIEIDPSGIEQVNLSGRIVLHDASIERLQVVAHALAKSVVLAHYEERVARVMVRVEELASQLRTGKRRAKLTDLLQEIGDVLLVQARTVGRAEVGEKPDITWEHAELERLYERLAAELDLRPRDLALSRKLDLISTTSTIYLDLIQTRKGIRVEWYIVALIVVEIVLFVYEMFAGA